MGRGDLRIARSRRHKRVRVKVTGTLNRPRLCVFRSLKHIYAQAIDDDAGCTLAAASTLETDVKSGLNGKGKTAAAAAVGRQIAKRLKERGVNVVVFDRGGYKYHGRVKALAEAAREAGLEF